MLDSRYSPGSRPVLWEERHSGVESVRTTEGDEVKIYSNGGQSSPAPGWELLLLKTRINPAASDGSDAGAVLWTLYGLPKPKQVGSRSSAESVAGDASN